MDFLIELRNTLENKCTMSGYQTLLSDKKVGLFELLGPT